MTQLNYQNYKHYKLPITINPLEYGKLIFKTDNTYIIQITKHTIGLIIKFDQFNEVKFFKDGDLVFTYKDHLIDDNTFVRSLETKKFTFTKNKLVNINTNKTILRNKYFINKLFITSFNYKFNKLNKQSIRLFHTSKISTNLAIVPFKNVIKLRKTKSKNIWKLFILNFGKKVFSGSLFQSKFNNFWKDIQSSFNNKNYLFILFKIKYVNNDFVTIGKLQKLNITDKDWYINWIIDNMEFKSEYYNETQIDSIIFSYGFKKGHIPEKDRIDTNIKSITINDMKLPISLIPTDFGKISRTIDIENGQLFILQNNKGQIIMFSKFNRYNEIEFLKNGNSLIKFKDEIISENKFVRLVDNKKYYFKNGEQFVMTKEMNSKFISKTVKSKNLVNKFITLDIETFIKDNILTPYCISIYDGKNISNFFLTNFKNVHDLIFTALKSIITRKYNGYNIYMHNMHKFEIIFLFKYLLKLGVVHPIIHNNRIISIDFNFGIENKYQIKFKDSLLLLLNSLGKLCKSFKVENPKSIFPIFFVNENNLDYIGEVPDIKYFKNINLNDYNKYKSDFGNNWSLKNEAIKYCNLDSISLYEILFKFNDMIFSLFNKNIHNYPTLPSLAFAIFRSNFMSKENIPQLSGKIADNIRSGYTGGAVDMYIPENPENIKIKCLDVNSLYPSQMETQKMPIGIPTYFNGDILKLDPNAFGFFYCKIIAPDNIMHPILQTHVKTKNGIRTISPIGTWEDMIFSEEMNNAMKYGYKFEVLWGYTFKSEVVFKSYVDFLYNLRSQYDKSNPLNFIAKILMNSLYGRFGMKDNFANINIIHRDYYSDFENKFFDNIIKTTQIDDYYLVEFEKVDDNNNNNDNTHNISVAIASAITAYSRIYMSQFKNNPKIILYYSDTDSIYVDEKSEIPEYLINNTVLGKLKLENICKKAIFLAPKVYCLETIDGETVYKVKGLKHEVELTFEDFENLLVKDFSIQKSQTKWTRNLTEGKINLLNELYTLKVTENKRKLIYKNNKLVGTKPYKIDSNKKIDKN